MHLAFAFAGLALLVGLGGTPAPAGLDLDALVGKYELTRSSDAATGRETLRGPGLVLVVAPGLSMAIVNGEPRPLSAPVTVAGGRVVLPAELVGIVARLAAPRAAAPPKPAPRLGARRLARPLKVVVDPGHGGVHTGGKSRDGRLLEKDVVLDVSLRLRTLLDEMGADVVMTRTTDAHFSEDVDDDLVRRVSIANRARADLFLSIHSNWHPGSDARGFEVFVSRHLEAGREGSRRLAEEIRSQFRANLDTEDRGIKEAGFKVIRMTDAPAVLVELEFISNPRGERDLADPVRRQQYAELLAEAVHRYAGR